MDSPYDLLWAGIGNPDEQCKASAVEHPGDVRLRRPERSVDIRTVQTRQGSNTQETCCPLDDPFILVTYPHFICIANSFSTEKEDTHTGYPQKASTRRDSNPRPSPWQGDTPPLSHSCISSFILFSAYLQNHILNFRNLLNSLSG